jgi:hypothetical protein
MNRIIIIISVFLAGTFFIALPSCKKDSGSNCDASATRGPKFTAARSLITSRCGGSGCHMNGQSAGGHNFDADCSIVEHCDDIQDVCCNSNSMPPGNPLNTVEKAIINDWMVAGGRITD